MLCALHGHIATYTASVHPHLKNIFMLEITVQMLAIKMLMIHEMGIQ